MFDALLTATIRKGPKDGAPVLAEPWGSGNNDTVEVLDFVINFLTYFKHS